MIAAGAKRRGSRQTGGRLDGGSLMEWVGTHAWRFVAMAHADVAVVLPKASTNPNEREVTSNSFGIAHLHHAFLRRSLQHRGGVEGKKKGWQTWPSRADVGETGARGDPALHEGMWMQTAVVTQRRASPAPRRCLSQDVCIMQTADINMHVALFIMQLSVR